MARQNIVFLAFNRGLVSPLALARADLKRMALSAEIQKNWMPRTLGSMMLRPGLGYLGSTLNNLAAKFIPFVFSLTQKALIELTDGTMRVWSQDVPIGRNTVSTTIANGTFDTNLANWTDNDEAGAASTWATGGYMQLLGTGTAEAIRDQHVPVSATGVAQAMRIIINRGPVTFRLGYTNGADDVIAETSLGTGTHSLVFTPTADVYVRFMSRLNRITLVDQCVMETAGDMTIPTPWNASNIGMVRTDQSADVVYCACKNIQQRKIERRAVESWSIVLYQPEDGPFRNENVGPMTMTPSVLTGNGTLTASQPFFRTGHVGALFAVTSTGQTVTKGLALLNDVTDPIRVTGITTDRAFTIVLAGMTAGRTVILERSFDNAIWTPVAGKTWAADTTESYTDGLDNQIIYYHLKLTVVGAAGTTNASLIILTGSIRGIARVTGYTSSTVVDIEVLKALGGPSATTTWEEGKWSDYRGWPTSVAFYEGRLWWAGKDAVDGSASDGYESYDPTIQGDSGPISRSIGRGPVETINWIIPLQRLILGGEGAEHSCRSTTFDEPLTPTNFNIKPASTQGSAAVASIQIDAQGIYVQRGGVRVFQLTMSGETLDYTSIHLSALVPEIGDPGIVRMAAQRQPDTRVHFVRSDGTAAILIFDKVEQVICWIEVNSPGAGGLIEDVVVLPGDVGDKEDHVYYVVKRTIGGVTKRYLERWATEALCIGGPMNLLADSYKIGTTGLSHLEGQPVVVWADGKDIGTQDDGTQKYIVIGGTLSPAPPSTSFGNTTVGLYYEAPYMSAKLVEINAGLGTALTQQKKITALGLIMANVHPKGLKFGPDFSQMDDLPQVEEGATIDPDTIRATYDDQQFNFPGTWDTNARLCLLATAPRPVTLMAAVCDTEAHD